MERIALGASRRTESRSIRFGPKPPEHAGNLRAAGHRGTRNAVMGGNQAQQDISLRRDRAEEARTTFVPDEYRRKVFNIDAFEQVRRVLDVDPDEPNIGVGRGRFVEDGTVGPAGRAPVGAQARHEQMVIGCHVESGRVFGQRRAMREQTYAADGNPPGR